MKEMNLEEVLKLYARGRKISQICNPVMSLSDLDIEIPDYVKAKLEKKQCYKNAAVVAQYLSAKGYKVRYAEGFVTYNQMFPIEHAFIILKIRDGEFYVVDPTFDILFGESTDDMRKEKYYLLKDYSYDELMDLLRDKKCYGPFC